MTTKRTTKTKTVKHPKTKAAPHRAKATARKPIDDISDGERLVMFLTILGGHRLLNAVVDEALNDGENLKKRIVGAFN